MRSEPKVRIGFAGQRLHFASRVAIRQLRRHPLSAAFHVLHTGWFPRAANHFVERPKGLKESILICCTSGEGWCEIGDSARVPVQAGEALYIPGGSAHRYGANPRNPWSIYWVHVGGPVAGSYGFLLPTVCRPFPMPVDEIPLLKSIFERCLIHLESGTEVPALLQASHAIRHVFGLLFFARSPGCPPGTGETNRVVSRGLERMRSRLNIRLSLAEIAAASGLSPSRFSTVFSGAMGMSPVDYHITLRMRAAAHLLDTTDLNIKEAAHQFGYEDPYYFSRVFKKVTGLSPQQYRLAQKG